MPKTEMRVDLSTIKTLRQLSEATGEDVLTNLVQQFVAVREQRMVAISDAFARGDARQLQERAHLLRGSAGALGAALVMKLAAELERRSEAGDLSTCALLISRLNEELKEACVLLAELIC